MVDHSSVMLGGIAEAISRAFLLPGEVLLSAIAWIAPRWAEILSFGTGGTVVVFVLALLSWTAVLIIGLYLVRLAKNFAWQVSARFRTLVWRIKLALGSLKTMLLWKYRQFFPHTSAQSHHVAQTEFDQVDIDLLRSVSSRGPGVALSAPDLAEEVAMRPSQVQQRLDNLARNNMLRSVIGSSDGYEIYRLTDSGSAFIEMWNRQPVRG